MSTELRIGRGDQLWHLLTRLNGGDPLCAEVDMEAFFPEPGGDGSIRQAKAVCAGCEISDACREYAVRTHQVGIWGGTTNQERVAIRRERRMGETGVEEAA